MQSGSRFQIIHVVISSFCHFQTAKVSAVLLGHYVIWRRCASTNSSLWWPVLPLSKKQNANSCFQTHLSGSCISHWIHSSCKVRVKQSRYIPGVAQRVPGGLGSKISWHSAHKGGEVVSLTHRPPLPQEMFPALIFTRGWVDSRAIVRSEEIYHWKIQWHHQKSIPGQSD
jgi:hypothetical protein